MRISKTYLYKYQTKKRNSFICFLLFRFLEALVLVFSKLFFYSFFYVCAALFSFKKFLNSKKNFIKLFEIVVVSLIWYFMKISAFEFFMSTISNIIVSRFFFLWEFFLNNFLHFHVFRQLLVDIYYFFIIFFNSSAIALLYWTVESF